MRPVGPPLATSKETRIPALNSGIFQEYLITCPWNSLDLETLKRLVLFKSYIRAYNIQFESRSCLKSWGHANLKHPETIFVAVNLLCFLLKSLSPTGGSFDDITPPMMNDACPHRADAGTWKPIISFEALCVVCVRFHSRSVLAVRKHVPRGVGQCEVKVKLQETMFAYVHKNIGKLASYTSASRTVCFSTVSNLSCRSQLSGAKWR